MDITPPPLQEKFLGCILGHAIGDAAGAPLEGLPATVIWYDLGGGRKIVANPPVEQLCYTDDTQMTIAVAEALLRDGRIVEQTLCDAFVSNYDPNRGYGQGARKVINAIATGADWRHVAANVFAGGSLGNGAAMRAAPVGLLFHDDLDRVWAEARLSALPTHVHPVGIEGAQLVALAVALCVRSATFDRAAFYGELISRATTEEFLRPLHRAAQLGPDESAGQFGSSLEAHRSVVTAIAAFAESPHSYADVVATAITFGDDTDTVAAMAGAMSGALLGAGALPRRLLDMLEDGEKGRSYLEKLTIALCERYESSRDLTR